MKKLTLITISLSLLFGGVVFAQETELPDPGMTPDSPFYFLERMMEATRTFFTFGDIRKAERHAVLATERLAEAKAVVEKGKPEFMEKTLERYEMQLNKSMASAEKAMTGDKNTEKAIEVVSNAGKTTLRHLEVLAEVYEKVSEQTKPAIENAMKASAKGHEKAVGALKAQNALGEVPEAVSLPMVVPQETRERIQRSAQEELMAEKVSQLSESSRELCTKVGGPQEMCEKIPVDGFESFEALKAFFIESGTPAEQWPVAESECKELGATTPDKCFRVLLFSSTSSTPAEVKAVPSPVLPEEEIEKEKKGTIIPSPPPLPE